MNALLFSPRPLGYRSRCVSRERKRRSLESVRRSRGREQRISRWGLRRASWRSERALLLRARGAADGLGVVGLAGPSPSRRRDAHRERRRRETRRGLRDLGLRDLGGLRLLGGLSPSSARRGVGTLDDKGVPSGKSSGRLGMYCMGRRSRDPSSYTR